MVAGNKELFLYNHGTQATQAIAYGPEGSAYAGKEICNIQVALNNKFFMIGIPSMNALGFFSIDTQSMAIQPIHWVNKVSNVHEHFS